MMEHGRIILHHFCKAAFNDAFFIQGIKEVQSSHACKTSFSKLLHNQMSGHIRSLRCNLLAGSLSLGGSGSCWNWRPASPVQPVLWPPRSPSPPGKPERDPSVEAMIQDTLEEKMAKNEKKNEKSKEITQ